MNDISRRLYSVEQLRELERRAIAGGTSGYALMQRAAAACWTEIQKRWPQARRLHLVCGPGNNGGDGYEIASLARAAGLEVKLWQIGQIPESGDAQRTRQAWLALGGSIISWKAEADLRGADLVVDALFGIGLNRAPGGEGRAVIEAINAAQAPVLAVDLPSGLHADTGQVLAAAVKAQVTVTFIACKTGLYLGTGPEHAGTVVLAGLEIATPLYEDVLAQMTLLNAQQLQAWLPPRSREAHKGSHGHVLVVGGDHGMMGAALLAARAALRAGAGLVSVATRTQHAAAMTAAQAELMCVGVESPQQLAPLIERAGVVVIGPGLGQSAWGRALFACAIEQQRPLVVDADALNLLALEHATRSNWVLTPHPGEAARLLDVSTATVQQDRCAAAAQLKQKFGGVTVLKGAGTLVQGEHLMLCPYGNPGMAVGGMGDVLAGIIVALMAQGLNAENAASAGVLAHALAGDAAAREGERGLLPSDLLLQLRPVMNP